MAGHDRLGGALSAAFQRHGAEIALEIGRETYSYEELWGRAWRFAETHSAQVGPDGTIGIVPQRSLEAYVAVLGAVILGRPYVSLNMKFPLERQLHIARESRCRVIVADAETEPRRRELMSALSPTERVGRGDEADERPIGDDDPVYYMFTSGTTGAPKGVVVARRNLAAYLEAADEVLKLPPGVRCTQLFELSFDVSVHDLFYTWVSGGTVCPMTAADGGDYVSFARAKRIGCWYSVPSVIAVAQRNGWLTPGALPDLRYCLFAGEALPTSLARQWLVAAPQATGFNLYGPTEATITVTGHAFTKADLEGSELPTVPIGMPFAAAEVVLVNADGELAGPGESGELWLGGPQVVVGYLNNPAETDRRFVSKAFAGHGSPRWYRTGDLGERRPGLGIVYLGRLDDQVKIRGYRVELFEVEEALRAAAGAQEAAAVPWPLTETGAADGLVAFVAGAARSDERILALCGERLPSYMIPSRILRVDKLPLNQNGKVDRKALRQQHLEANPERQFRPVGDVHEVERRLVEGWSRLFPGREVDATSTFASMNGDSLSYINILLETEALVGSLPPGWVGLSIADLAQAAAPETGTTTTRVDMPALIRMAAISLVVLGHFGVTTVDTGAVGAMMLLSGYFFGAVPLSGLNEDSDVRRLLRPLLPLAAIYYGLYVPVTWLHVGSVKLADLLLLRDLTSGGVNSLWYVHAMAHVVMAATLLAWGAQALARAGRRRFDVPMAAVAAMLVLGGLASYVMPVLLPHLAPAPAGEEADSMWRYSFVGQMFVFACGAILALRTDLRGQLVALGLLAGSGLVSVALGHPGEGLTTLASAVALVFVTDLRVPRLLARPIYAIADASLFIYLLQPVINDLLLSFGLHRPARLGAVMAVGVGLAWARGRLLQEPVLQRLWQRLAKLRPVAPVKEISG